MSPHICEARGSFDPGNPPRSYDSKTLAASTGPESGTQGANGTAFSGASTKQHRSHLRPCPLNETFDLVCIGFGPANLALAIGIHDALDARSPPPELEYLHSGYRPKVLFLERQAAFAWHGGMLLSGAKMQISFMKDLATLRDPRSAFTFINYLHEKERLVRFTNLGTFLPERIEYQQYMGWCAAWFNDVVKYGSEVVGISPASSTQPVREFKVTAKDVQTGLEQSFRAKHIVIGVGGRPNIPPPLSPTHSRILHSSRYASTIGKMLPDSSKQYKIAVIGAGQSAAEIFNDLQSRFRSSRVHMVIKSDALRPSDDSPFVNEIFEPSRVTPFYAQRASRRQRAIRANRSTNYAVVRPSLLEHIYASLYSHRVEYGSDEELWPFRILANRRVAAVISDRPDGVTLLLQESQDDDEDSDGVDSHPTEARHYDAVVCATGYIRDSHEDLLEGCRTLRPELSANGSSSSLKPDNGARNDGPRETGSDRSWQINRDYSVVFADGAVASPTAADGRSEGGAAKGAGIWLQGCNEATHGLSDSLLSILATRAGELVRSIFGDR